MAGDINAAIRAAAQAIQEADALLIGAGAGIGVDSGLPDFRGGEGFWRAYPPFAELGLSFIDLANPRWFRDDPELAWGFYGHRLQLYRHTQPHAGFNCLLDWIRQKAGNAFVFTSNVDGQFQKAGFDAERILECHGSIHYLQCSEPCSEAIWLADDVIIEVDETSFRAVSPLPECPHCGAIARPNILLFYDGQWLWNRTSAQEQRYRQWLSELVDKNLAIIECGAGTAIPTVRRNSEELMAHGATLIRINAREAHGSAGTIAVPLGALEALERVKWEMSNSIAILNR